MEAYDLPDGVLVNGRESFSPIFRDVTELTAAHSLSEKIKQALQRSNYLIVLCSPASKDSHWVNEEIRLFRELHGDRAILSAIIEGTPSTSFPPALLEGGHEPLAANLKQGRDSFRFGVHQLAASILDVGLDTLVQRAQRKRRLRARLMTAAASGLAVVMGGLWYNAHQAQQAAEKSRDDAERLVEYMVSDLKSELYSLQRLDILDGLGEEIVTYYEGLDPTGLPDERLVRLITAIQSLSEVAIEEAAYVRADRYLKDASNLIDILEARDSDSDDSLFYRAQNQFWKGQTFSRQRMWAETLLYYEEYNRLSQKLYAKDPANTKWAMESGWGFHNIAIIKTNLKNFEASLALNVKAKERFRQAYDENPMDLYLAYEFANIVSSGSRANFEMGKLDEAIRLRREAIEILERAQDQSNMDFKAAFYQNQNRRELLKYLNVSPCHSVEFQELMDMSAYLYQHEPGNAQFHEEFLGQRFQHLLDCLMVDPENVTNEDIESDLRLAANYKKSWEIFYREEIEKLRTLGPELEEME